MPFYDWSLSGALQEGTQHPEQADSSEVQPADEAGDGPDHRYRREAQRGHRSGLREGHRRAQLLRGLRKHVPLPRHGKLVTDVEVCLELNMFVFVRLDEEDLSGNNVT